MLSGIAPLAGTSYGMLKIPKPNGALTGMGLPAIPNNPYTSSQLKAPNPGNVMQQPTWLGSPITQPRTPVVQAPKPILQGGGATYSDANSSPLGTGYAPSPNLPSSATAGGGATFTDANSSPSGSGYQASTFNPDDYISNYLKNDALLGTQSDAIKAQQATLKSIFQTAAEQAAVNYGAIPNFGTGVGEIPNGLLGGDTQGLLYGALSDPTTQQNAANNQFSTTAQLLQAYNRANSGTEGNLVARGLANSGAWGQELNNNLQGYQTAGASALQAFLGQLSGAYGNYTTGLSGLNTNLADYYNQATQRAIALINAGVLGNPQKQPNPGGGGGGGDNSGGGGGSQGAAPFVPPTDTPYYFDGGQGTYSDANSTGGYGSLPDVTYQGVPIGSPGAAAPNHPGRTIGGYIPGGGINT